MKKIIIMILFICCLVSSLLITNNVLNFKYGDGIYDLEIFYEQPTNSIDVMVYGSSHAFEDINTAVLWNDYGISSFVLGGSVQPLWNTYFYIKESLKYQRPKLLVVDTYLATMQEEYSDDSRIIKNNFGLKISDDKFESLQSSAPADYFPSYMLEYPVYHARYNEINKSNFLNNQGNSNFFKSWKGNGNNFMTTSFAQPDVESMNDNSELSEKSLEYLLKIIDLSNQEKIPLLLITTPYVLDKNHQAIFNTIEKLSNEMGVPYINYNSLYKELDLNFTTDFADVDHLNHIGNAKFSSYFGGQIKQMYEISDHRGDIKYESYDKNVTNWVEQLANQSIKTSVGLADYLNKIKQKNIVSVIKMKQGFYESLSLEEKEAFYSLGLSENYILRDTIIVSKNAKTLFVENTNNAYTWSLDLNESNTLNVRNSKITINNNNYEKATTGICIITYNTYTNELIESVTVEMDSEHFIQR